MSATREGAELGKCMQPDGERLHQRGPKCVDWRADEAATPRPWEMHAVGKRWAVVSSAEAAAGDVCRASLKANAEFIVRAVNSHDELVGALDGLLRTIGNGYFNGDPLNHTRRATVIEAANDALARARGER